MADSSSSLSSSLSSSAAAELARFSSPMRASGTTPLSSIKTPQIFGKIEKSSIVIEFGAGYTKIGFGGECFPRHIISTELTTYSGTELSLVSSNGHRTYSDAEWKEACQEFLRKIFFDLLQISPVDRTVLIVESILAPQVLRKTVVQLLFERFKVAKIKVSQSEPIALYATSISGQPKTPASSSSSHSSSESPSSDQPGAPRSASKTPMGPNLDGLVIDMGFGEIRVVPVYQGIVLSSAIQTTSHSWQNVVALMRERMQSSCPLSYPALPQRPPLLPSPALRRWVIEDVITKVCFVTARRFNETVSVDPSQQQKASSEWAYDEDRRIRSTAYLISTGKESQQAGLFEIKGRIRAHILDHLFADGDELSLQNIIVNSLRKLPVDLRLPLSRKITFIGGGAGLAGFLNRVYEEVNILLSLPANKDLKALRGQIDFVEYGFSQNVVSWTGASLIADLDFLPFVTRETYETHGFSSVPDWTQS